MNIADIRSVLKYSKWLNIRQRNNIENKNAAKLLYSPSSADRQRKTDDSNSGYNSGVSFSFCFLSSGVFGGGYTPKVRGCQRLLILLLPFSETEQPHTSSAIFFFNSSSWINFRHQTRHSPFVIAKRIRVTKEILFPHCSFPYSSEWRISFFLQKWWLSFVSQL